MLIILDQLFGPQFSPFLFSQPPIPPISSLSLGRSPVNSLPLGESVDSKARARGLQKASRYHQLQNLPLQIFPLASTMTSTTASTSASSVQLRCSGLHVSGRAPSVGPSFICPASKSGMTIEERPRMTEMRLYLTRNGGVPVATLNYCRTLECITVGAAKIRIQSRSLVCLLTLAVKHALDHAQLAHIPVP
jgi:hypothetical protein